MAVTRFGVSLENDLLEALDEYVYLNKFPNRSQAIRHLVQKNIVESKWQCDNIVAGAIVLIYSKEKIEIQQKLAEICAKNSDIVLCVQQFYLPNEKCMEVVSALGKAHRLTNLSDLLIVVKGVEHGKLLMSKAD
ncbi:MAG: nickel-responsive transcriptional regulator NikR [Bacteroidales bacterium]